MTDADAPLTVIEAIRAGRYANTMPRDPVFSPVTDDMTVRQVREMREAAKRERRKVYDAEWARLRALFKADLEREHGVSGHPKADKLFELAWGHSCGHEEVAMHYSELAELLTDA